MGGVWERPAGSVGDLVSQHRNSQRELVTIERSRKEPFAGQLLLCIYDDKSPTIAITLLDEGMQRWLREQLEAVDP